MNRKWVFFQALLVTIAVFVVGFYVGVSIESGRTTEVNNYFTQSEVSLVDILAFNNLVGSDRVSCENLVLSNKDLLDRVYGEATSLSQYEEAGKLTEGLKTLHTKYDVLRTYLWINSINIKKECPKENFSTIVYLYNHDEEDLTKKAEQAVWSRLLFEVKSENENALLIPIAHDSNLISLDYLIAPYNITDYPVVIINEKKVFYNIPQKEEVISWINNSSI